MLRSLLLISILVLFGTPVFAENATPVPSAPPPQATPAKPFVYTPDNLDIVIGDEKAPVTIVEYASLSCPHCAHFFTEVLPKLSEKYIDAGKVKLIYRHFPLNKPALQAAILVECADKDRQHAFLKVLFSTQTQWAFDVNGQQALANIGTVGGVTPDQFNACLSNKELEKSILQVEKTAADDYKVNSTPSFFINGQLENGDHGVDAMSAAIDQALKSASR